MPEKLTALPVSEKDYEQTMVNVVEPYLASIGAPGYFNGYDGKKLHYESYMIPDATGTVVISHGFTESAEPPRPRAFVPQEPR